MLPDRFGNLWIADSGNGRVLDYQPPFNTGMNASLVIGEPDFNHRYCQPNEPGFNSACSNHSILTGPGGIAFDPQGNLWVSEYERLLEFKPLFKTGMDKSLLIQPVYSSDLTFDANGNLWLSCGYCYGGGGGSVVGYRPPFNENGIVWKNGNASNADFVVGEPLGNQSYSSKAFRSVLVFPRGLTFDSAGNLWVVDARSSWLIGLTGRVAGYDAQAHPLKTQGGRTYFENDEGLLMPLSSIPISQMGALSFPEGIFNFTIQGLNPTGSVTMTISFPNALPAASGWWYNESGRWIRLPASQVSVNGRNLTLTLTGASPDGVVTMLGGPALVSGTTSSTKTLTNTTRPATNIAGFPGESIVGGIVTGLVALTILRYSRKEGSSRKLG